jgi:vacuolar protein sorting-associated protein 53
MLDVYQELLTQINHLRAGATETEVIVRDITHDIRNLDLAKRNIVASMTGVKRFQMLGRAPFPRDLCFSVPDQGSVNAFDQLMRLARAKRYRETAPALHVSSATLLVNR